MGQYLESREELGVNQSRLEQSEPGSNVTCHPEVRVLQQHTPECMPFVHTVAPHQ